MTPALCLGPLPREYLVGAVVDLMAHSRVHQRWFVRDLHTWIAVPMWLGQFFPFTDGRRLVGFFTWARLTEEAESAFLRRSRPLAPGDWNAGERVWIIDALAPFGGLPAMARAIRQELTAMADAQGWTAREARWSRTFGTGSVQHVGRAGRVA